MQTDLIILYIGDESRVWSCGARNDLKFDYFDYICAPKTKQ